MINLMPPQHISEIRHARANSILRRWLGWAVFFIFLLILLLFGGWLYIAQQSSNLQKGIEVSRTQLEAQNLTKVQQDAAEITGDIKVINQVLSREIRFSDLIQSMGKVMPAGTVLDSLSLGKVDGAIDLAAGASDYKSAAQIAINLSDPKNGLFSKVDIVSISCGSSTDAYKCSVSLKALFDKSVQKKFLNVPSEVKS